jgi:hypothetical protein
MARKQRPEAPSDKQSERFKETARELDVDESGQAFESAFRKIVPAKRRAATTEEIGRLADELGQTDPKWRPKKQPTD